ncbi:hypothetical protein D3C85_1608980 [compost metagenome]
MPQEQKQCGEPLLTINYLERAPLCFFDHQGLQAVKIIGLGVAAVDKFADVLQQLSDLQRLPPVSALIGRNPKLFRVSMFINEQLMDRFEA